MILFTLNIGAENAYCFHFELQPKLIFMVQKQPLNALMLQNMLSRNFKLFPQTRRRKTGEFLRKHLSFSFQSRRKKIVLLGKISIFFFQFYFMTARLREEQQQMAVICC